MEEISWEDYKRDNNIQSVPSESSLSTQDSNIPFRFARNIAAGTGGALEDVANFGIGLANKLGAKVNPLDINFDKLVGVPGSTKDRLEQFFGPPAIGLALGALNPVGREVEGAALSKLGQGLVGGARLGKEGASSVADFFNPGKTAEETLQKLTGSPQVAIERNAESLSGKIRYHYNNRAGEALEHLKSIPEDTILESSKSLSPEEITKKATDAIKVKNVQFKNGRLSVDIPESTNTSSYAQKFEELQPKMGYEEYKYHKQFMDNPTFKNAEDLRKQLGDSYSYLKRKVDLNIADQFEKDEFKKFGDLYETLKADITEGLPEEYRQQYQNFLQKWEQNVVPYRSDRNVSEVVKDRSGDKVLKSEDIHSFFREPTKEAKKVATDIGEEGRNQILHNRLIQMVPERDAKKFVDSLDYLGRGGGYSHYITPEISGLKNKIRLRNLVSFTSPTVAGGLVGALGGHPFLGAGIGAGADLGIRGLRAVLGRGLTHR